ncbi:MAG: penicillin-binding protein 2 [Candidatus Krumholzibacteriota bacterium]|nr:penicillin-binding protein 2 [Candidatus Krumholzibacteriota bacterium]
MAGIDFKSGSLPEYRKKVIYFIVAVIFAIFTLKLFYMQVSRHDYYRKLTVSNRIHRERIIAPRGVIRDEEGKKLVVDIPRYQISVSPGRAAGKTPELKLACGWFGVDEELFFKQFSAWKEKYPDGREMIFIKVADKEQISILMENRELFPFFNLVMKHHRQYPHGSLAAHILGHIGEVTDKEVSKSKELLSGDVMGRMGVEKVYDDYLRGRDGVRLIEKSAGGTRVSEYAGQMEGWGNISPRMPIPGDDLYLTIGMDMQNKVEELLDGRKGSIVVMNPGNGEILAAASYPTFDPNLFSSGVSGKRWRQLNDDPDKPLFNRSVQAEYPPGSVFKPVVGYAALNNKLIFNDIDFQPCGGGYQFGNRYFKCWKREGHGRLNLTEAIMYSCDTYFYQLGEALPVDEIATASRLFGLGRKCGVDLPGEARGIVPDRNYYNGRFGKGKWTRGHLLNLAIGQGDLLSTPVQLCLMTAIIANGGKKVFPHFVKKIVDNDGEVVYRGDGRSIQLKEINRRHLNRIRESLEKVVSAPEGTGRFSRVPGVRSAGKTGTAQNPHGEDHAVFIAYAPVESPRLAIVVILENAGHGGVEAGPISREIMSFYFGLSAEREEDGK